MIRLVNYGQLADAELGAGGGFKNILILQGDSGRQVTVETSEKSLQDLVGFIVRENGVQRKAAAPAALVAEEVVGETLSPAEEQQGDGDAGGGDAPEPPIGDDNDPEHFVGSPFPQSGGQQ